MAGTDDLVAWLGLQLDEDERGVREWTHPRADGLLTLSLRDIHEWTERAGPARVLREVEAKRKMLDLHWPQNAGYRMTEVQCGYCAGLCHSRSGLGCDSPDAPWPCDTVRLVAAIYSDRPGYQEDWRP